MSDISSYLQGGDNRFFYKKQLSSLVVEKLKQKSNVGNSPNSSGDDTQLPNGIVFEDGKYIQTIGTVESLSISDIMDLFTEGNLTVEEMDKWITQRQYSVKNCERTEKDGVYTYKFTYGNKEFTLSCSKAAAESQTDNITQTTFSSYALKEFDNETIDKYFFVAKSFGSLNTYAFKPDCGISTLAELREALKAEAETEPQAEAEAKARASEESNAETEAKAKAEEEAKAKAEAEAKAKAEAEAEAEAKAKAEAEAKAKAEEEAKAKAEAEAKAKAEAEAKAKAEEEAKAKAEAEAKAKAEAEAKAKAEAEAKADEEAKPQADEEAKAKTQSRTQTISETLAKLQARVEARAQAKAEAEAKAKAEEEAKAKAEAEAKAKAEAEAKAKAEAEAKAKAGVSTNKPEESEKTEETYTYSDGSRKVTTYDGEHNVLKVKYFDKYGRDMTGRKLTEKVTTETGYTEITKVNGDIISKVDYVNIYGDYYPKTFYDGNNNIIKTSELFNNDDYPITIERDADGNVLAKVEYDRNGNETLRYSATTKYNADGSYTVFFKNEKNGAVHQHFYDKNNNIKEYGEYNWMSGHGIQETGYGLLNDSGAKVTASGFRLKATDIYEGLTNIYGSSALLAASWQTIMRAAGCGDNAIAFLKAAQADFSGRLSGASTTYTNYNSTKYAEFLKNAIEASDASQDYGYKAEDIKGYQFNSNSALSKTISTNQNMTSYIKNNINTLLQGGNNFPSLGFYNCGNSDLTYSLGSTSVIDSKLSGTSLTLTIADIYDFDAKYLNNLNSASGKSDCLNAAGAAAMMDGELKPFFTLIDVTIDLKTIFSNDELKNLGII